MLHPTYTFYTIVCFVWERITYRCDGQEFTNIWLFSGSVDILSRCPVLHQIQRALIPDHHSPNDCFVIKNSLDNKQFLVPLHKDISLYKTYKQGKVTHFTEYAIKPSAYMSSQAIVIGQCCSRVCILFYPESTDHFPLQNVQPWVAEASLSVYSLIYIISQK